MQYPIQRTLSLRNGPSARSTRRNRSHSRASRLRLVPACRGRPDPASQVSCSIADVLDSLHACALTLHRRPSAPPVEGGPQPPCVTSASCGPRATVCSPTVTLVRNGPLNTACRTLIEESSGCEDDQAALQGAENRSCLAQVMRSGTVGLETANLRIRAETSTSAMKPLDSWGHISGPTAHKRPLSS